MSWLGACLWRGSSLGARSEVWCTMGYNMTCPVLGVTAPYICTESSGSPPNVPPECYRRLRPATGGCRFTASALRTWPDPYAVPYLIALSTSSPQPPDQTELGPTAASALQRTGDFAGLLCHARVPRSCSPPAPSLIIPPLSGYAPAMVCTMLLLLSSHSSSPSSRIRSWRPVRAPLLHRYVPHHAHRPPSQAGLVSTLATHHYHG